MKNILHITFIVLFSWGFATAQINPISFKRGCKILINQGDKTNAIQNLGNIPDSEGMIDKEKNIWDLEVYRRKVYVGYGNTTTNPGPLDLYAYSVAQNNWTLEVDDYPTEAFERFRIFQGKLFVPNSDEKPNVGHRYMFFDGSAWTSVSDGAVNDLYHVRDMYYYNGYYYMVGNLHGILRKSDHESPTEYNLLVPEVNEHPDCPLNPPGPNGMTDCIELVYWSFGFLPYEGKLIIPNYRFTEYVIPNLPLDDIMFMEVDGNEISWSANMTNPLEHHHFYPVDYTTNMVIEGENTWLRPFEHASKNGTLLYTLRSYFGYSADPSYDPYLNNYNNSKGLFFKSSMYSNAEEVRFPDEDAVGEDLLKYREHVYALAHKKISPSQFKIYVYRTENPSAASASWDEVFHFYSSNMTRSFEFYGGHFYFGLGMNHGDLTADAGDLLRIRGCSFFAIPFGSNEFVQESADSLLRAENWEKPIMLYPNPATDQIHLDIHDHNGKRIFLLHKNGQVLKEFHGSTLDLSEYHDGVYFIRIEDEFNPVPYIQKIIISRQ